MHMNRIISILLQIHKGNKEVGLMIPGLKGIYGLLRDRICCIRTTHTIKFNPDPRPTRFMALGQTTAGHEQEYGDPCWLLIRE